MAELPADAPIDVDPRDLRRVVHAAWEDIEGCVVTPVETRIAGRRTLGIDASDNLIQDLRTCGEALVALGAKVKKALPSFEPKTYSRGVLPSRWIDIQ